MLRANRFGVVGSGEALHLSDLGDPPANLPAALLRPE
jgi:hypothetical protein